MKVDFTQYVKGDLRGIVDIELNNGLLIKGFKLMETHSDYWVAFPSEKGKDGNYYETVRPISKEVRKEFTGAILNALKVLGIINDKIGGAVPQHTQDEY